MEKVIELLQAWKKYLDEGNAEDFAGFGAWLKKEVEPEPKAVGKKPLAPDDRMAFGRYFGTLTGFAEAWERIAFKDLPIKGFTDFDILNLVREQENPTKNTIAQYSTLEQSTVFELIKRLQRKGFLRDEVDATDRRVKRVFLTDAGQEVIGQVIQKAFKMADLMVGDLSSEEINTLVDLLKRLNVFHENLHSNKTKEEIREMNDL